MYILYSDHTIITFVHKIKQFTLNVFKTYKRFNNKMREKFFQGTEQNRALSLGRAFFRQPTVTLETNRKEMKSLSTRGE